MKKSNVNFEETLDYLDNLNKRGIHPGLTDIRNLLEALGNPQKDLRVIHVAGTNGKGSTAGFIARILKEAGFQTGLYRSPAVFTPLEIISVNGRNISQKDFCRLTQTIKETGLPYTRFELETVVAFLYFKEKECDPVILECGMGGELDATNVCQNTLAAVFTAIGMDHMAYLGNTLEAIARTKAGIIRDGCPVIADGGNRPEVLSILKEKACEQGGSFFCSDPESIKKAKYKKTGTVFDYKEWKELSIRILGKQQTENAATALETVRALSGQGLKIRESAIRKGLAGMQLPGRFEKVCDRPLFFLDGAHNEPASLRLQENLEFYCEKKKIILILCVLKDKEYDKVIENTCGKASMIFTVMSPNRRRGLPAIALAEAVRKANPNVTAADSIEEAVEMAFMLADPDTAIVSFGSLSHLGKVKKAVEDLKIRKNRQDIRI